MAIYNRENLHAPAAFREPHGLAPTFGRGKCRVDETLAFIDGSFVAQCGGQVGQHLPQNLLLTPLLEPTMDRFIIRIALRQEVPLGPGIQNLEHRVQHRSGGDGLPPRTGIRDVLFGKVFANPLPLIVAQPQHAGTYRVGSSCRQLF